MYNSKGIIINSISKLKKGYLEIEFTVPDSVERFFNEKSFFSSYSISIDSVPDSILSIPLLANLLPVAWANDVNLFIDEVDETFYESIPVLKDAFQKMYPKLNLGGHLIANKIVKNEANNLSRSSQLFSGGIDSLTTYIRRSNETPYLVTIWGADVRLDEFEAWEQVRNYNSKLAKDLKTEIVFVKSNFKEFLNQGQLKDEFGEIVISWWAGVQHGLGLSGLCAPITYEKGLGTFYIGSSHTVDYKLPYGSHPSIDNNIKWGSTNVIHDSYDLTRQEKINMIADYITNKYGSLQIRVCWLPEGNGGNCNECEKCSRTIIGLILAGLDPNQHGFYVSNSFPSHVKKQFETQKWKITEAIAFQWQDVQDHIPHNLNFENSDYRDLFIWLKNYKLRHYQPSLLIRVRLMVAKALPERSKRILKKIIRVEN
ncbi:hypothetical protein GH741_08415 [Aquibacillus halophilus]|uniref:Uncharacterized protein n=1 Tax=Aquibacillus halophilus TaxID=930132 RepID=A0A6A8DFS6_9BACI|nr:hypothetical protein [Aquibacillus halophilus]MRH42709.1 hypothetical protein [Aquibacillus halophilus]